MKMINMSSHDKSKLDTQYFPVVTVPVEKIVESRFQFREDYGDLATLSQSIATQGLIEPILVRPVGKPDEEKYEIVHGHRRLQAVKLLRWQYISAQIRELTEQQSFEISLTENVQRKDLNAIEEGLAFKAYMDKFNVDKFSEVAKRLKLGTQYVEARVRFIDFQPQIQNKIREGGLSIARAEELLRLQKGHEEKIPELAQKIETGDLPTIIGARDAVGMILDGTTLEQAVEVSRYFEVKQKMFEKAALEDKSSVRQVLREIQEKQVDSDLLKRTIVDNNRKLVSKMIEEGMLTCPNCGGEELVWNCCGKRIK